MFSTGKLKSFKNNFNVDFDSMLMLPFNVYWKNLNGFYLGCNNSTAESIGLDNRKEFIDMSLSDFTTNNCATLIETTDQNIMKNNITQCVVENGQLKNNHQSLYLSIKSPLYDSQKTLIGLYGISISFRLFNLTQIHSLISRFNVSISTNQLVNSCMSHYYQNGFNGKKFSKREMECLYYLKHGRNAKETARFLNIDHRTVEYYIKNIKEKLNCNKKTELLDKLQENDFFCW